MLQSSERLIVALDKMRPTSALTLAQKLTGKVGTAKVNALFTGQGPGILGELQRHLPTFLDLKFHDIPETVREHAKEATLHGVRFFTVHTLGGIEMMRAAREGVEAGIKEGEAMSVALRSPKILGITILTSQTLQTFGALVPLKPTYSIGEIAVHLATMAKEAGLDGVVCSPQEVGSIRRALGDDFLLVTPGIRPAWALAKDDQKRIGTPCHALGEGADYLVVGRPITQPPEGMSSEDAVDRITEEMLAVL